MCTVFVENIIFVFKRVCDPGGYLTLQKIQIDPWIHFHALQGICSAWTEKAYGSVQEFSDSPVKPIAVNYVPEYPNASRTFEAFHSREFLNCWKFMMELTWIINLWVWFILDSSIIYRLVTSVNPLFECTIGSINRVPLVELHTLFVEPIVYASL